jgi:hypothetical protein
MVARRCSGREHHNFAPNGHPPVQIRNVLLVRRIQPEETRRVFDSLCVSLQRLPFMSRREATNKNSGPVMRSEPESFAEGRP